MRELVYEQVDVAINGTYGRDPHKCIGLCCFHSIGPALLALQLITDSLITLHPPTWPRKRRYQCCRRLG